VSYPNKLIGAVFEVEGSFSLATGFDCSCLRFKLGVGVPEHHWATRWNLRLKCHSNG